MRRNGDRVGSRGRTDGMRVSHMGWVVRSHIGPQQDVHSEMHYMETKNEVAIAEKGYDNNILKFFKPCSERAILAKWMPSSPAWCRGNIYRSHAVPISPGFDSPHRNFCHILHSCRAPILMLKAVFAGRRLWFCR